MCLNYSLTYTIKISFLTNKLSFYSQLDEKFKIRENKLLKRGQENT